MFAKIINGVLYYAPVNYKTDLGQVIVNFNTNEEMMLQYGYKNVIDIKPDYNKETQYLKISGYTDNEDNITVEYEVVDKSTPEPTEWELLAKQIEKNTQDILDTQSAIDYMLFGDLELKGGE